MDAKTVWNSLELFLFFFNWTFLGLHSGPLDFFWARVSLEGPFLGLTISPHSHIPVTNVPPPPGFQRRTSIIAEIEFYLQVGFLMMAMIAAITVLLKKSSVILGIVAITWKPGFIQK